MAATAGAAAPDLAAWAEDYGLLSPATEFQAAGSTPAAAVEDAALKVALWRAGDRVLLAVANPGDQAKDAVVKLDLDTLGLTPRRVWQDFLRVRDLNQGAKDSAAALDFYGRSLAIKAVAPKTVRLVAVRRY